MSKIVDNMSEYANNSVGKQVAQKALSDLNGIEEDALHVSELNGFDELPEEISKAFSVIKKYMQKSENEFLGKCVEIRKNLSKK